MAKSHAACNKADNDQCAFLFKVNTVFRLFTFVTTNDIFKNNCAVAFNKPLPQLFVTQSGHSGL